MSYMELTHLGLEASNYHFNTVISYFIPPFEFRITMHTNMSLKTEMIRLSSVQSDVKPMNINSVIIKPVYIWKFVLNKITYDENL